jgi:hypothetical protein
MPWAGGASGSFGFGAGILVALYDSMILGSVVPVFGIVMWF